MTPHILRNGLIAELFYRVAQCYRHRPNCAANSERSPVNFITFQRINYSWLFKDFSSCLKLPNFWRGFFVLFSEGKAMATAYDCKFIETSVGINHNVDELLVGLLTQIRLKLENPEKTRWDTTQQARRAHHITVSFCFARQIQRFIPKAFVSKIKATRMFTSRRYNMFIWQSGYEPKYTSGTLRHWYKYAADEHPKQV